MNPRRPTPGEGSRAHEKRRGFVAAMFSRAMIHNLRTIAESLSGLPPGALVLDPGCQDGLNVERYRPGHTRFVGLDVDEGALKEARDRKIRSVAADLCFPWPVADASFDAVVSNQVVEHLPDTDRFFAESYRVLRPGGLFVLSTENLASWHNIAALVLGWQPFSLTNVSQRQARLGNPMAALRDTEPEGRAAEHVRVFTKRGLRELAIAHGFALERVRGAGYYPLPSKTATFDATHAAFITLVARRPRND